MNVATTGRVEITFPGRLRYLPAVRELVREAVAEEEGFGDVAAILLAVQEACVNAIRHGNGSDASLPVEVAVEIHEDGLELTIADRGPGFRLEDLPESSDLRRESGRGLSIIRAIMDETRVDRRRGRTLLRLVKRRAR